MLFTKFSVLDRTKVDTEEKLTQWLENEEKAAPEQLRFCEVRDNLASGKKELQICLVFNDKSFWKKLYGASITKRYVVEGEDIEQAENFVKMFETSKEIDKDTPVVNFNILEETDKEGRSTLKITVSKPNDKNAKDFKDNPVILIASLTCPLKF